MAKSLLFFLIVKRLMAYKELKERNIDFIVLAGYLAILTDELIDAYPNKIMNIHPSLIPSFCGPGMYGMHVHEAVLQRGAKVSGATVHFVSNSGWYSKKGVRDWT